MSKRLRLVFVLHNPRGSSGLIGERLSAQGHEIQCVCPLNGDELPELDAFDAVIVFGGKMSANDHEDLPELLQELLWIRACVEAKKPFLGICLGAQLLAMSFGGQVTRHPERMTEIGYYHIYPTVDGFLDIFANMPERFFQWHNEGFTLPDTAVKLAASDLYPNQAFRLGNHAYGFQFHPEATKAQIDMWHQRDAKELAHPGAQMASAQYRYYHKLEGPISTWLDGFLAHWLNPKD
ncbi:gamma-glutamyl-gamma-aminobutyrate hydrolase family protein [Suttonella sp. R2A3]|uniref:glutamine amidotransferase-related protein n=1 Tax=Suttonella sp. R2A3 TaxID=2908648 RepID=UPI001F40442F|nr:gamma-glutamyl-gamma-aminobutyrate hydrolase family protein [Suttonella sp. R2A3]UJF24580.1 gamma-glutamyl-gamma-aminobutyrate hydrolase family protein [Suttonella sp. R2A3]